MNDLSFINQYSNLDDAIINNFYSPKIDLIPYPEEIIYEVSSMETVDDIKNKLYQILQFKEKYQDAKENNEKYYKQQQELIQMFWDDCFIESNINILPKKIKEAIIEMIIEKAKELNYMGNFIELRKLFIIFSKEMIENFSKLGGTNLEKPEKLEP